MSMCTACANICIITENRKDELMIRCPTIEKKLLALDTFVPPIKDLQLKWKLVNKRPTSAGEKIATASGYIDPAGRTEITATSTSGMETSKTATFSTCFEGGGESTTAGWAVPPLFFSCSDAYFESILFTGPDMAPPCEPNLLVQARRTYGVTVIPGASDCIRLNMSGRDKTEASVDSDPSVRERFVPAFGPLSEVVTSRLGKYLLFCSVNAFSATLPNITESTKELIPPYQ